MINSNIVNLKFINNIKTMFENAFDICSKRTD